MTEGIIVALITLVGTLIGVFVSAKTTREEFANQLEISQAVTNNEIKHLTEEVKKHNQFAERIPHIESRLDVLDERVKVANNRIKNLEEKGGVT